MEKSENSPSKRSIQISSSEILKAHGRYYESEEESDGGKSDFDDEYYKLKPPPYHSRKNYNIITVFPTKEEVEELEKMHRNETLPVPSTSRDNEQGACNGGRSKSNRKKNRRKKMKTNNSNSNPIKDQTSIPKSLIIFPTGMGSESFVPPVNSNFLPSNPVAVKESERSIPKETPRLPRIERENVAPRSTSNLPANDPFGPMELDILRLGTTTSFSQNNFSTSTGVVPRENLPLSRERPPLITTTTSVPRNNFSTSTGVVPRENLPLSRERPPLITTTTPNFDEEDRNSSPVFLHNPHVPPVDEDDCCACCIL